MAMILFGPRRPRALPHAGLIAALVAHAVHWLLHRCARAVSSFGVASRPSTAPLPSLSPTLTGAPRIAPRSHRVGARDYIAQWSTDEIILKIKLGAMTSTTASTSPSPATSPPCSSSARRWRSPRSSRRSRPTWRPARCDRQTLCGVSFGLLVGSGLSVIALAANGVFEPLRTGLPTADMIRASNPCAGQKPKHSGPGDSYFNNVNCWKESLAMTLEQAGGNVTRGFKGTLDAGDRVPITVPYSETDLCPVNVHWHLGAEHLGGRVGNHGPALAAPTAGASWTSSPPRLAASLRYHKYDSPDARFADTTTACTPPTTSARRRSLADSPLARRPWQYQSPSTTASRNDGIITIAPLNTYKKIGVQSQTFTVINDEAFYADNLFKGMLVDSNSGKGSDIAMYTGSTTGTSRDNSLCSRYTPITWQVDRKCHLISASSFDKLCYDMSRQWDDMSGDYPHGSRTLVWQNLTANNQQSRQ